MATDWLEKFPGLGFLCGIIRQFICHDHTPATASSDLDWNRLEHLILHHNLAPVISAVPGIAEMVPERAKRWHRSRINVLGRNIQATKASAQLFSILEKNQIEAVSMRGLHLANFLYPDPGLRPMRDVDLLIVPEDREKLITVLQRYGYEPNRVLRSQLLYDINNIPFEIHWSFLTPKRYRAALDARLFVAARRKRVTSEGVIFCLPAEHEFLGVVAHAFIHHDLDSLMRLLDIGIFLEQVDLNWEFIMNWCRKIQLSNLFSITLSFVNDLFGLNRVDHLQPFNLSLPRAPQKTYEAYAATIWGQDQLGYRVLRLKNLLYVAEKPFTKFRQFIRSASIDESSPLLRLLFKTHLSRKGGAEQIPGRYGTAKSKTVSKI